MTPEKNFGQSKAAEAWIEATNKGLYAAHAMLELAIKALETAAFLFESEAKDLDACLKKLEEKADEPRQA